MRYPVVLALGLLLAVSGVSSAVRATTSNDDHARQKKVKVHAVATAPSKMATAKPCGQHGGGHSGGTGYVNTGVKDKVHTGGVHVSSCGK